jgi:hypothetical protein
VAPLLVIETPADRNRGRHDFSSSIRFFRFFCMGVFTQPAIVHSLISLSQAIYTPLICNLDCVKPSCKLVSPGSKFNGRLNRSKSSAPARVEDAVNLIKLTSKAAELVRQQEAQISAACSER